MAIVGDMKETEASLIDLGMTHTEARIYLSGLACESISAQEIAKQTGIKRPTVYHALSTLMDKGLVAQRTIGGKAKFSMSPPAHIQKVIREQKEALELREQKLQSILPLLTQQYANTKQSSIATVQYEGVQGVKMVLDIAFYSRSHHWDIIAPTRNFLKEYDSSYKEYYLKARKYYGITARSLWEHKPTSRKLSAQELRERNPRIMPKSMQGRFQSMMLLFDDKVAIISPLEKLSAILITSQETKEMFLAMFDAIWDISTPLRSE
jgi:sugar-specific transcriptional regulator TrmB